MKRWLRWIPLSAMAALLAAAGCAEQGGSPTETQLRPVGTNTQLSDGSWAKYRKLSGIVPATEKMADSAVFNASGGQLRAAGYILYVPAGAVLSPTKFKMVARTDGTLGVALTATRKDAKGNEIDVGATGFYKKVLLGLFYGWATEQIPDPYQLMVAWDKPDGTMVATQGHVHEGYKLVYGWLSHFSEYVIIFP